MRYRALRSLYLLVPEKAGNSRLPIEIMSTNHHHGFAKVHASPQLQSAKSKYLASHNLYILSRVRSRKVLVHCSYCNFDT